MQEGSNAPVDIIQVNLVLQVILENPKEVVLWAKAPRKDAREGSDNNVPTLFIGCFCAQSKAALAYKPYPAPIKECSRFLYVCRNRIVGAVELVSNRLYRQPLALLEFQELDCDEPLPLIRRKVVLVEIHVVQHTLESSGIRRGWLANPNVVPS